LGHEELVGARVYQVAVCQDKHEASRVSDGETHVRSKAAGGERLHHERYRYRP
jgi:hypothetical protein